MAAGGLGACNPSVSTDEIARAAPNSEIAAYYADPASSALWTANSAVSDAADQLVTLLSSAADEGLSPQRYPLDQIRSARLAAASGDKAALARTEALLSAAYVTYFRDLRTPPADAALIVTDPSIAPAEMTAGDILRQAAAAPSLRQHLAQARRVNFLYDQMRDAYVAYRATPGRDPGREAMIAANLARARAMPADPGRRFILVDVAGSRLFLYEDGQVADTMKVVVGKVDMQTPAMSGVMRYAMFNPYWNVPEDLARDQVAPAVLRDGPRYLAAKHMETLSDWSDQATVVAPETIDWAAVAEGRQSLRVRQRPGPDNMMGEVKFMLPNDMGIYLHDTPAKALFNSAARNFSSGCVRLEDARRLARWLYGPVTPDPAALAMDQRVDLPEPVPVYIMYLTVFPEAGGLTFRPDVYNRDPAVIAAVGGASIAQGG